MAVLQRRQRASPVSQMRKLGRDSQSCTASWVDPWSRQLLHGFSSQTLGVEAGEKWVCLRQGLLRSSLGVLKFPHPALSSLQIQRQAVMVTSSQSQLGWVWVTLSGAARTPFALLTGWEWGWGLGGGRRGPLPPGEAQASRALPFGEGREGTGVCP